MAGPGSAGAAAEDAKERPHAAAHEAGHAVAAHLCGLSVDQLWPTSARDLGHTESSRPKEWSPDNLPAFPTPERAGVHRLLTLRHLAGKAAPVRYSRHIDPNCVAEGDDEHDLYQARGEAAELAKLLHGDAHPEMAHDRPGATGPTPDRGSRRAPHRERPPGGVPANGKSGAHGRGMPIYPNGRSR